MGTATITLEDGPVVGTTEDAPSSCTYYDKTFDTPIGSVYQLVTDHKGTVLEATLVMEPVEAPADTPATPRLDPDGQPIPLIKLSEAIRIGAQQTQQVRGQWAAWPGDGMTSLRTRLMGVKPSHACALGAALVAVGEDPANHWALGFGTPAGISNWNARVKRLDIPCHCLKTNIAGHSPFSDDYSLRAAVIHMNDHHGFTREEIADHISTLGH